MPRRRISGSSLLFVTAIASCDRPPSPAVQPTAIPLGVAGIATAADVTGTWIGEYREVRCETNGEPCPPTRQGWIQLVLPWHEAPPTQLSGTFALGRCGLWRQVTFDVYSGRVNGVLRPNALSLAGASHVPSGITTRTIETTIVGAGEMHGRFTENGRHTYKGTGRTTSDTHEYELGRIVRHVGALPTCARQGGEVPPPVPAEPAQGDIGGTWIGEYRQIGCEMANGIPCEIGQRGWVRVRLPSPAVPPASVSATIELGTCTSFGTIQFGDPFPMSGSVEPRRLMLSGRQATAQESAVVTWMATIASAEEMFGGIVVDTTQASPGEPTTFIRREHEVQRARRVTGPLPACSPSTLP